MCYMHVHMHVKAKNCCFVSFSITLLFFFKVSANPELIDVARLFGQWAPSCLCLHSAVVLDVHRGAWLFLCDGNWHLSRPSPVISAKKSQLVFSWWTHSTWRPTGGWLLSGKSESPDPLSLTSTGTCTLVQTHMQSHTPRQNQSPPFLVSTSSTLSAVYSC